MIKTLNILGYILLFCSLVTVSIGMWTFSFDQTTGTLVGKTYERIRLGGMHPGIPFASSTGSIPNYDIEYTYSVGGHNYKSKRIGMGLSHLTLSPFERIYWEHNIKANSNIQVYYSDKLPAISVIYRGVDWVLSIFFIIFGSIIIVSSNWLKQKYT